jgi:hypothetical protein
MGDGAYRKGWNGALAVGLAAAGLCMGADASAADVAGGVLPPGYSSSRTGDMHDFDYFVGGWTTTQRRLKACGKGSNAWEEFPQRRNGAGIGRPSCTCALTTGICA